jgi:metal-dependent HD superfamily phosphatase/phosphodiesterase
VQVAAVYRQKENSHGKVNAGIVVDAAMHTCQQCSEIVLCSR